MKPSDEFIGRTSNTSLYQNMPLKIKPNAVSSKRIIYIARFVHAIPARHCASIVPRRSAGRLSRQIVAGIAHRSYYGIHPSRAFLPDCSATLRPRERRKPCDSMGKLPCTGRSRTKRRATTMRICRGERPDVQPSDRQGNGGRQAVRLPAMRRSDRHRCSVGNRRNDWVACVRAADQYPSIFHPAPCNSQVRG